MALSSRSFLVPMILVRMVFSMVHGLDRDAESGTAARVGGRGIKPRL